MVCIAEAYYAYNYTIETYFVDDTKHLGNELNVTSSAEPYYWLNVNAEREMLYNTSTKIMKKTAKDIVIQGIFEMKQLNNLMQINHIKYSEYLSSNYLDTYFQIMNNDTCI